jgi:dienelactone hydrolase
LDHPSWLKPSLVQIKKWNLSFPAGPDFSPDASHGFHTDYQPSFRKDNAQDAWKKLLDWFKKDGVA